MLSKAEDLVGQQLAGYRLREILGRGGMSIVFLAERLDNPQERVAIKVLRPAHVTTPEEFISFQTRFLREAQTVQRLRHEHILPVLGYGEVDDILYMIMPVIPGGTLAELLALKHGTVPLAEIASYLNQLASAIDYAHQHGFLHRDIKPSNVLLDGRGGVYLVDFGIAHLFDSGLYAIDQAPTSITTTGKIYGTPIYMAPERFRGEQAEPATDVYALGVLLYQLVTGEVPFKADSPLIIGMKHINEMPPSPRSLRPDLPEPAEAAMLRALAKQPADRFATAAALAAAFEAGIQGQWAAGLLPLPPLQAGSSLPGDTQEQQPGPAPVGPMAGGPFQANQPVPGPAFAPVNGKVPGADERTRANSSPVVQPGSRERNVRGRLLLTWALLIAVVLLILLSVLGLQKLYTLPEPGRQVPPTSTSAVPTRSGLTPASSVGATPTLSPQGTATAGVTPTASPKTTPSPGPSATPVPTATATPVPAPTATPAPSPTPKPTP